MDTWLLLSRFSSSWPAENRVKSFDQNTVYFARCLISQFSKQKNVRPGFLNSPFSQRSEPEKPQRNTPSLRRRKMEKPGEKLGFCVFSGDRYGPGLFSPTYVYYIECFRKNFLPEYALFPNGYLDRFFKKNLLFSSSFLFSFLFSLLFSFLFFFLSFSFPFYLLF